MSHVFSINHELYYSTKEPVPIVEIVESLLGLEKLIKMSPSALQRLTGVEISHVDVLVSQIESGSLLQRVLIRFFFKDEDGLNEFIDKARAKVGDKTAQSILVSAVLLSMTYFGAKLLAESNNQPTTTINANNNVIINIGAGEVDIKPDEFRSIIESSINNKKELAKSTLQILTPSRADNDSSIQINDDDRFSISSEVIRSTPHSLDIKDDIKEEILESVELHIRAANRDSLNSGWTARVPQRLGKKKLKLKLVDSIDPETIASLSVINGDIKIRYRYNPSTRHYDPEQIILLSTTDSEE